MQRVGLFSRCSAHAVISLLAAGVLVRPWKSYDPPRVGFVIDTIYQVLVLQTFHPIEALIVAYRPLTLFLATFSTLLAIINPLEALPGFSSAGRGQRSTRTPTYRPPAYLYAVALMFFFLTFSSLILRVLGIPLSNQYL